jgi:adenosylcobinamide-GDP ribazoletransferase
MSVVDEIRAAVRFLTILPVRSGAGEGFGAVAFPLVGLFLGICGLVLDRLLAGLGRPLVDVALVVYAIVATGAIHLDGLADACDGLGGREPKERLRLMAEGSIGTFGVLGLIVAILVRLAGLLSLAGAARDTAILLAPIVGRSAMLVASAGMRAARPGGLGAAFLAALEPGVVARGTVLGAGLSILIGGLGGALAFALAAAAAGALRPLARNRLGGTTGDVIGASGEIAEGAAWIALAAWSVS